VGESYTEAGVGHRVEHAIQRVLAEEIALEGAIALAVRDELQPVLAGERRVVDLLGGEIEPDRWKPAPLEPENAARPQFDAEAAGVGPLTVPQRCGVVFALCAAIAE